MKTTIAALSLLFFFASPSAFADTYNFIFAKPKKAANKTATPAEETDDEDKDETETEETKPAPAPAPAPSPLPTSIIINNQTGGSYAGALPTSSSLPGPSVAVAAPLPEESRSWLRVGLSGGYFLTKNTFGLGVPSYGGLFHLNVSPSTVLGVSVVVGMHRDQYGIKATPYGALEFEFNPLSFEKNRYGVVELNLIAGINDQIGRSFTEGIHGGLRLNVNFTSRFGLTFAGRVGSEMHFAEAGLVTRL